MKRLICLLVALLMVIALFAGCGGGGKEADKTTNTGNTDTGTKTSDSGSGGGGSGEEAPNLSGKITLAIWNGQKQEEFEEDAKAFMEAHPGTEIEVEFIEKIETIKTRMAANELPDIAQVPQELLKQDYPQFYEPIEDLGFSEDNYYFYNEGVYDGHLYVITHMINFEGICYNKRVFQEAGITEVPKTLDELYEACEKLKANGVIPYAINFKDKWPLGAYSPRGSLAQARSGDPDALNKLANTDELLSGPYLDNLNFLRTMYEKGYVEPDLMSTDWGAFCKDISAGKFGMTFLGSWFPTTIEKEEERGMFPFPEAKYIAVSKDWDMGIAKNSKAIPLAKEYFKHLFLTDKTWCQILGYCSAVKGADYPFNFVDELLSYGVPVKEATPMSDEMQAIFNAMAVDMDDIAQEYITTSDPQAVIDKYNKLWAEARKAVQ